MHDRYGRIRLWGAVSFGVCSLVGGLLIDDTSDPSAFSSILIAACGLGILAAGAACLVSLGGLAAKNNTGVDDGKMGAEGQLQQLKTALCKGHVVAFLLVVFLSGCASGLIDTFLCE